CYLFFDAEIDDRREHGTDDHPQQLEPIEKRNAEQVGLGPVVQGRPKGDGELDDEEQVPPAPATALFLSVHRETSRLSLSADPTRVRGRMSRMRGEWEASR